MASQHRRYDSRWVPRLTDRLGEGSQTWANPALGLEKGEISCYVSRQRAGRTKHAAIRENEKEEELGECYHERCSLIENGLIVDACPML